MTYYDVLARIEAELRYITNHCLNDKDHECARLGINLLDALDKFENTLPAEAKEAKFGNPWESQR